MLRRPSAFITPFLSEKFPVTLYSMLPPRPESDSECVCENPVRMGFVFQSVSMPLLTWARRL